MTLGEMHLRGWDELDVLIVTGDAYVDHPSFGAAVIGRVLEARGLRVGILAQPAWQSVESFRTLGRPRLFCGITSGNLDSMLAGHTAARHRRKKDNYSEEGIPGRRPDHALIVYTQRIKEAFPGLPVIIGGIEASLRRVVHYDYWEDRLRPSVLVDTKADLLVYGMGEEAITEAARQLSSGNHELRGIRGTAYLLGGRDSRELGCGGYVTLPSWEHCQRDRRMLVALTKLIEAEQNPFCARPLVQFHAERALIIEPPSFPPREGGLDRIYELPFSRRPHPLYEKSIPAFTMVKDSITAIRGCAGGCSFCSLSLHQGKFLTSRTIRSISAEIDTLIKSPTFRGTVSDLGGPTANLYGCRNGLMPSCRVCRRPGCLYPSICTQFKIDEKRALSLYREVRIKKGVHHLFINSGIRMDVALRTPGYLRELVHRHVSGHLKVAPEHLHEKVLKMMRKPGSDVFHKFCETFERESRIAGLEQYLVPYFISSFPGCSEAEMKVVGEYLRIRRWNLQQVQDFIPLPMTPAAAMYYSGLDYDTEEAISVTRGLNSRRRQREELHLHKSARLRKSSKTHKLVL